MNVQGSVTQVLLIEDNSQIGHARQRAHVQRQVAQGFEDLAPAGLGGGRHGQQHVGGSDVEHQLRKKGRWVNVASVNAVALQAGIGL